MDSEFPARLPAKVFVKTVRGSFDTLVTLPWGEPDRQLDRTDLVAKFHTLARGRMPENQAANIVTAVEGIRDGEVEPLLDALEGSIPLCSSGDLSSESAPEFSHNV